MSATAASGRPDTATRDGHWILAGTVASGALNYLYALSMAALLSPRHYTVFASGHALLLITGTVANAGVPWLLAREIAVSPGNRERHIYVVWFGIVVNLGQGLIAAAVVFGVALGFAGAGVAGWLAGTTVWFFIASTTMGWAQGHSRLKVLAVLIAGEVAVKVSLGVTLVALGAGPGGAFAAALCGAALISLAMLPAMRSELRPVWVVLRDGHLWRGAFGMGAIQTIVTAMAVIDVVIIPLRFGHSPEVAGYQLAATLSRAPLFVALAFASAAFPELARRPGDRAALSGILARALAVFVPVLIVMATLPHDPVASVLPSGYGEALRLLPLTAGTGAAYALITIQTTALRAGGHFRECLILLAAGGVVALGCMLLAVHWGIIGLGIGALVGAWLIVAGLFAKTERLWPGCQRPPLRPLLLWPPLAVVLILVRPVPVAWIVLAAAIIVLAARSALAQSAPADDLELERA